jgi:hypothetical protein
MTKFFEKNVAKRATVNLAPGNGCTFAPSMANDTLFNYQS